MKLFVDPSGERAPETCACCGTFTRQIWGFIERGEAEASEAHAAYFIRWTDGHPEQGISVAVSIGGYGGSTSPRICVGMECFVESDGPVYRFVEPDSNPFNNPVLGRPVGAHEATTTDIAASAMQVMAAFQACDQRFASAVTKPG